MCQLPPFNDAGISEWHEKRAARGGEIAAPPFSDAGISEWHGSGARRINFNTLTTA